MPPKIPRELQQRINEHLDVCIYCDHGLVPPMCRVAEALLLEIEMWKQRGAVEEEDSIHDSQTQLEMDLCSEYWSWLYAERSTRQGVEPSDAEKARHPAMVRLHAIREIRGW